MRGGGAGALIVGALLLVLLVPSNVMAEDVADLEFGPNEVFSHEETEFWLTFHNTADREIALSDAVAVIEWPGEPWFINQTDPDIVIDFMDGTVTVPAGGSVTFRRSVYVDLSGGFSVDLSAKGKYAGDATSTIITGSSFVDCSKRQFFDARAPLASAFSMFILLFACGLLGFFVRGAYWGYEIKKNLEDDALDELQYFKWFLFIWWNRGHKVRVIMFFAIIALLFALITYSALT